MRRAREHVAEHDGEGAPLPTSTAAPKTGHPYSANIDDLMREALGFVLAVK